MISFSPYSRKILFVFFVGFVFFATWITQRQLTGKFAEMDLEPNTYYVPEARFIKPFLLGHEGFLADLVWIRTIGYFADDVLAGGRLRFLEQYVNLATDLDPRFEKIYIWAGAVSMYSGGVISKAKIHSSTRMLEKGWNFIQDDFVGWDHQPDYWLIPQMIGFNYAVELKDKKKGAPFIAAAARIPGSPELFKTWAATLYKRSGEMEEGARVLENMLAIETLQSQLQNLQDESVKERIQNRLNLFYKKLYGDREALERVQRLQQEIQNLIFDWKEKWGFIGFDQYLLLRSSSSESAALNSGWKFFFPLMSL